MENRVLKNDLLLRTLNEGVCERPPVWIMRQAGRILPQYRKIRASLSGFKELVSTPDLAAEVTIQPVDELKVDAAIIFSDILVIPEAMNLPYEMVEKKGPYFPKTVRSKKDLDQLVEADPERLSYVTDAIKATLKGLDGRVPLIGFAGAPWTIFCYMVEGGGSKTFSHARAMLYREPEMAARLMDMITLGTIKYLKAQIKAGVHLVQIFDSWAGILSPQHYRQYALPALKQICEAIDEVPVTVFAKGAEYALKEVAAMPCRTIGLDWNMNIHSARELVGKDKVLQGNLDPCQLYGPHQQIEKATTEMMEKFKGGPHIVNLGHGVYPDTPLDGVKCFVNTVLESA